MPETTLRPAPLGAPIEHESPRVAMLLRMLDDAYDRAGWHGPNLRGSIRRVRAPTAAWRPAPGRKCIAEITLHCAYWKYAARRRLTGEPPRSFAIKGSNWFPVRKSLSEATWREHQRLLDSEHAALRQAVAELIEAELSIVPPGSRTSQEKLLYGIAMHDVYHAGQIQTLKRLAAGAK